MKLFGLGASQGPLWGQRVPSFLLFPLPVDEKAVSWTWCAHAMSLSPCLSKKIPVCRRKGRLMDLVCACDGLSPLPVEEKAISWIWSALAMGFSTASPCLSKKRPSHGPSVRLRWACPPACQGKGRLMDLACACDGISIHFLLSVQEKAVLWTWCALAMGFSPCLSRKNVSWPRVPQTADITTICSQVGLQAKNAHG